MMMTSLTMLALITGQAPDGDLALTPLRSLGVGHGRPEQEFGSVQAVVTDARGRLLVLDSRLQQIRVFDSNGVFLHSAGRGGRGPGEFFLPLAMVADGLGRVYVLDTGNSRVSVFESADSALSYLSSFPLGYSAFDFCLLGKRLYVLGFHDGTLVHAYSTNGELRSSFGSSVFAGHPILARSMSRGLIECIEDTRSVVVLPALLPDVRAYAETGGLSWAVQLVDYNQVVITQLSNGSVRYEAGRDGFHHVAAALKYLGADKLLVQLGRLDRSSRTRDDYTVLESRTVRASTGIEVSATTQLPLVKWVKWPLVYAAEHEPYPRVVVHRSRAKGGR
jgi:hypothetical protein